MYQAGTGRTFGIRLFLTLCARRGGFFAGGAFAFGCSACDAFELDFSAAFAAAALVTDNDRLTFGNSGGTAVGGGLIPPLGEVVGVLPLSDVGASLDGVSGLLLEDAGVFVDEGFETPFCDVGTLLPVEDNGLLPVDDFSDPLDDDDVSDAFDDVCRILCDSSDVELFFDVANLSFD